MIAYWGESETSDVRQGSVYALLPSNGEWNTVSESLDVSAPVEPEEIEELLRAVRLTKVDGDFYRERAKKFEEVVHFITHLLVVMRDVKRKKQAVLLDCGTGRSYLSFVANMVLSQKAGRDVYFIEHIPQESIVIPENIDGIRAMMGMQTKAEDAIAETNKYLGIKG